MNRVAFLAAIFCFVPLLALNSMTLADEYKLGADSQRQPGVPQGVVSKHEWKSKIFADTVRDYYVYVPKQYDGSKPTAVMVFQDGHTYVGETGDFRVPIVFNN